MPNKWKKSLIITSIALFSPLNRHCSNFECTAELTTNIYHSWCHVWYTKTIADHYQTAKQSHLSFNGFLTKTDNKWVITFLKSVTLMNMITAKIGVRRRYRWRYIEKTLILPFLLQINDTFIEINRVFSLLPTQFGFGIVLLTHVFFKVLRIEYVIRRPLKNKKVSTEKAAMRNTVDNKTYNGWIKISVYWSDLLTCSRIRCGPLIY